MAIFTPTQNKQQTTVYPTGVSTNLHESQNTVANPVEQAPIFTYTVTPLSSANARCIVSFVTPTASIQPGVSLPLYTANTNIFQGNQCFVADCERGIAIEFTANPTTATTAFVFGYDYRGVAVNEQIAITTAGLEFFSQKQYSYVYSVYFLANPGRDVQVICNNQFGFPHYIPDDIYILSAWYGTSLIGTANYAGGYNWRNGAAMPSLTSSSARGFIAPGIAIDGSTSLVVTYYVQGEDSSVQTSLLNEATVEKQQINSSTTSTIDVVRVQSSPATRQLVMPTLLSYDTYGVQYPGNADFIDTYVKLYNGIS